MMNRAKIEKIKRTLASQAEESQSVNSIDWEPVAVRLYLKGLIPKTMLETEVRQKHSKKRHLRIEEFAHGK